MDVQTAAPAGSADQSDAWASIINFSSGKRQQIVVSFIAYLLSIAFVSSFYVMGFVPTTLFVGLIGFAVLNHLVLFVLYKVGWLGKFTDSETTLVQLLIGSVGHFVVYAAVPEIRSLVFLNHNILFLIGMAWLSYDQLKWLWAFCSVGYMLTLVVLTFVARVGLDQVEIVYCLSFVVLSAWFVGLAGYINVIRDSLANKNNELLFTLDQVNHLAVHDDLTKVFNRRYIGDKMQEELHRYVRTGSKFCVLMIDLDFFKHVNDTLGHLAGDRVLIKCCEICQAELREVDILGRFGGEEFIVVMPASDIDGACIAAERIRAGVARYDFREIQLDTTLTVSIGVAEVQPKDSVELLIARADSALYRAKDSGRNCIVIADAEYQQLDPPNRVAMGKS